MRSVRAWGISMQKSRRFSRSSSPTARGRRWWIGRRPGRRRRRSSSSTAWNTNWGSCPWMLLVGVGVGIHGHAADRHRRTAVVVVAAGDVERNLLCRRRRTRGWVARSIGFDFESILVKKKEVQCARARGNYVLVHVRGRGTRTGAGLLFCYSSLMQVGLYQRRPWNNVT